jgi:hypothetical protein
VFDRHTTTRVTDAALTAASLADPAAFAAVFDRHWAGIHRFCASASTRVT